MFKRLIISLFFITIAVSNIFASKVAIIDTPNINILNYGSYEVSFRAFGHGGVHTRLDFGVFKLLDVGVSWELANFLGSDQIKVAVPALSVKFRLYGGDMTWPGFALGYDGQGYFYNADYEGDYLQKGKGLYLVIGREFFLEGLMLNVGVNMNDFSDTKVYGFLNAIIPIPISDKEVLYFMTEYDNINYFPDARLNAGLRFTITEVMDIDFIMRDCFGKDSIDKVPNERVLKISYTGKF